MSCSRHSRQLWLTVADLCRLQMCRDVMPQTCQSHQGDRGHQVPHRVTSAEGHLIMVVLHVRGAVPGLQVATQLCADGRTDTYGHTQTNALVHSATCCTQSQRCLLSEFAKLEIELVQLADRKL